MDTVRIAIIGTSDEDDLVNKDGLYVTLLSNGKVKRHLIAGGNEMPLSETTIAEELIQLTEHNFADLSSVIMTLYESLDAVHNEPDGFSNYQQYIEKVLCKMESTDILSGTLARTMLIDMEDETILNEWYGTSHVLESINKLYSMLWARDAATYVLDDLCKRIPVDLASGMDEVRHLAVTQVFTFSLDNVLTSHYFFRSEANYYFFLMQQYIASKPNIAKCQLCGRYFLPKTRKKTLYCDRVIKNGKTCKQVAPRLKRKELAAVDRVVGEFDRCKKMQYVRFLRTGPDKMPSIIDITPPEYWAWLTKASEALASYLVDEISEDEALAIIYVPKKNEILESNSAELTVANPGT